MEPIIIILLLVIIAEATYLIAAQSRKKASHKSTARPIFVDTSVLIDGRIIAVAQSGFISDTLFIPRSVIGELQFLADNADNEKRARARHGLDVVSELQKMDNLKVEIFQDGSKAEEGVDERLLKLAKQYNGAVCTIDYNLNKVAQVEKIPVLNVNDLAMSLRMAYLPGEKILLELTQKGQDGHQAIGHLTDGTMVVVEHASNLIGKTAEIEFIRSLQTAAGKMMFAKLTDSNKYSDQKKSNKSSVQGRAPKKPAVTDASKIIQEPALTIATAPLQPKSTFHSDKNDQYLAKRNSSNGSKSWVDKRPKNANSGSSNGVVNNLVPRKPNAPKRPRSSEQNEEDLINLVNSQQ